MSSSEKPVESTEETATNEIPQLGALEEDDEFEEFPAQGSLTFHIRLQQAIFRAASDRLKVFDAFLRRLG